MTIHQWTKLATYGSGLEADTVVERLHGAGFHSYSRSNGIGAVGPGFQGVTPGGVDVFVLNTELQQARDLLASDEQIVDEEH